MKRIVILILMCSAILCGCSKTETYVEPTTNENNTPSVVRTKANLWDVDEYAGILWGCLEEDSDYITNQKIDEKNWFNEYPDVYSFFFSGDGGLVFFVGRIWEGRDSIGSCWSYPYHRQTYSATYSETNHQIIEFNVNVNFQNLNYHIYSAEIDGDGNLVAYTDRNHKTSKLYRKMKSGFTLSPAVSQKVLGLPVRLPNEPDTANTNIIRRGNVKIWGHELTFSPVVGGWNDEWVGWMKKE